MSKQEIKETLEKQFRLLSEHSSDLGVLSGHEIASITEQMVSVAIVLAHLD